MKPFKRRLISLHVELLEPRAMLSGMIGGEFGRPPAPEPHFAGLQRGGGEFRREAPLGGRHDEFARTDCVPGCMPGGVNNPPPKVDVAPMSFGGRLSPVTLPPKETPAPPPIAAPVVASAPPRLTIQVTTGVPAAPPPDRFPQTNVAQQFTSLSSPVPNASREARAPAAPVAQLIADEVTSADDFTTSHSATAVVAAPRDDVQPNGNVNRDRLANNWDEAVRRLAVEEDEESSLDDLIELDLRNALRRRQKNRPAAPPSLITPLPQSDARGNDFRVPSSTPEDNAVWQPSDDGLIELLAGDRPFASRGNHSAARPAPTFAPSVAAVQGEMGLFQAAAEAVEEVAAAPEAAVATVEPPPEPPR